MHHSISFYHGKTVVTLRLTLFFNITEGFQSSNGDIIFSIGSSQFPLLLSLSVFRIVSGELILLPRTVCPLSCAKNKNVSNLFDDGLLPIRTLLSDALYMNMVNKEESLPREE